MKNTAFYSWWLRRRTGGVPLHRNPLCRASDRLQQISALSWFLVAALTIPVVGIAFAPRIVDSWQAPPMTPTTAVVEHTAQAPAVVGPSAAVNIHPRYDVQVRWVAASGSVRHGTVRVLAPAHRGAEIRIWASMSGERVAGSRPRDSRALDLIVLIVNVAVDVCLAGYGAHRLLRWRLNRRRLRAWDAELSRFLARR